MMYQRAKTLYMTPTQTVGKLDWSIEVLSDGEEIRIIPMWRRPGSGWMTPADLPGPVPGAVLSALLEPDSLLALARVVENARKP
jgi:hypothetical protein